jgi:hypothetical protein
VSTSGDNGGAVRETRVTQLVFTLDHDTMQVAMSGTPCSIAEAQMILGEAARQLEEQRRAAYASTVAKSIHDAQHTQGLLDRLSRRG